MCCKPFRSEGSWRCSWKRFLPFWYDIMIRNDSAFYLQPLRPFGFHSKIPRDLGYSWYKFIIYPVTFNELKIHNWMISAFDFWLKFARSINTSLFLNHYSSITDRTGGCILDVCAEMISIERSLLKQLTPKNNQRSLLINKLCEYDKKAYTYFFFSWIGLIL